MHKKNIKGINLHGNIYIKIWSLSNHHHVFKRKKNFNSIIKIDQKIIIKRVFKW